MQGHTLFQILLLLWKIFPTISAHINFISHSLQLKPVWLLSSGVSRFCVISRHLQQIHRNFAQTVNRNSDGLAPSVGRYAVCHSIRAGTVSVWNLARRRFVGRPVRVEHGLYSSTDVVLTHDLKLYIFTDKSSASSTDDPSYRFQVRHSCM